MKRKKDLPLAILKALEPYVKLKGNRFEVLDPGENLLRIVDKDEGSTFHFTIEQYQLASDKRTFQMLTRKSPSSQNSNEEVQYWLDVSSFGSHFEKWVSFLDEYDNIESFYDDPILKSFKDEFYSEFELIDDDAPIAPFTTTQILALDSYLENLHLRLKDFDLENQNTSEIEEIQSDILLLRKGVTRNSKQWVLGKLSGIWAKIAKQGIKYIKEFLVESKKELTKELIHVAIDYVVKNGGNLLG